jgi:NADPH:quinone reductase-like Zn-dependent oxidoreductase
MSAMNTATTDHSQMMKQWQFTKSGNPRDVLTMVEVPIPTTCTDDEALVQISHVSLNSAIAYRLIAHYGVMDPVGALMGRPCVPEMDFSGIVCDLRGANVKEFKTGNINQLCRTFLLFHYFL